VLLDAGLGLEADAETGLGEHRRVVGPVSDRDRLADVDVVVLADVDERVVFRSLDQRAVHVARELAVGLRQAVRDDAVDGHVRRVEGRLHAAPESAREHDDAHTVVREFPQDVAGAVAQADAVVDVCGVFGRESGDETGALPEALGVGQFTAHRALGDVRDLVADPVPGCEAVHHLRVRERAVEVERDERHHRGVDGGQGKASLLGQTLARLPGSTTRGRQAPPDSDAGVGRRPEPTAEKYAFVDILVRCTTLTIRVRAETLIRE